MSEIGDMYRRWHEIEKQRGEDERVDFLLDFINRLHDSLDKQVNLTEMYIERLRDSDVKLASALDLKARCIMELSDVTKQRDSLQKRQVADTTDKITLLESLEQIRNITSNEDNETVVNVVSLVWEISDESLRKVKTETREGLE